ncbi:MAG: hypothetical protein GY720_09860 [bacterium]|nr:hypothetical protein [bacterium]
MWSIRKSYSLIVIAAVAAATLTPTAAAARGAEVTEIEIHCVVYVTSQAEDGEYRMSSPECHPTKEEAARAAAEPFLRPQAADLDSGIFAMSSFTLGIHYDGSNGSGSSIRVVGTSCTGGHWNTPHWFDNRESSSCNGCYRLRHYDKPAKKGSGTNTYGAGTTDNLASWMNNRTESVAYFSS